MLSETKKLPFVIFAAGKGTRAWPLTQKIPKVLLEIKRKPLICYVLDTAKEMGAKEAFIFVGHKKEMIQERLGSKYNGITIKYFIVREISQGLVCSIEKVKEIIKSDFVLLLGDEIYIDSKHKELIYFYQKEKPDGVCGVRRGDTESIKKNYSVRVSGKIISGLSEKPAIVTTDDLQGCGTYIFQPSVFDFIGKTPVSRRTGRRELADLIQVMINAGKTFPPFDLEGLYININTKRDLKTAEKLLKKHEKN